MDRDIAIRVEGLGKRYRMGGRRSLGRRVWDRWVHRRPARDFWALRGLDFDVRKGEVVGIIGANGAGKSTLLKILSGVTWPTEGRAEIRGRVASMLEVGTGFNPELTGRENVLLSGAILGMSRQLMGDRMGSIVEFADIGDFLDTPVKHYSSGMYLRLAFAVAAHLDPDVLIVDEVLAVGDASFQRKCLGRMGDAAHAGRTVLFVSHSLGSVKQLCTRAIFLEHGRIARDGPVADVVRGYLDATEDGASLPPIPAANRPGSHEALIGPVEVVDTTGRPKAAFFIGESFCLRGTIDVLRPLAEASLWLTVEASGGEPLATNLQRDAHRIALRPGAADFEVSLVSRMLPGTYVVEVGILDSQSRVIDQVRNAATFRILPMFEWGGAFDGRRGVVLQDATWHVRQEKTHG